MNRLLTVALVAALPAAASAGTYSATPNAGANGRIITKSASWACGAAGCTANTDASRPLVICQGLAKKVGKIDTFTVDGRALGTNDLAKCNALARAGDGPANTTLAKN